MAIEHTAGNLLDADVDALVNAVNCVGVMGKGLALQFRKAYPRVFDAYKRACTAGEVAPGKVLTVPTGQPSGPAYVIHFPTKRHWRGASRLDDIDAGLPALAVEIDRLGVTSIAVPPLGCGLGGLPWADVRPRIEAALAPLTRVRVLLYGPGVAAAKR
jgi:O-acetyl-ADP-ribose deacetylase (regulator of RNase III)